jgi:2-amino-4-hydroxy-6-hydroxymethyldihydropteridine diphosphokinase
MTEPVASAAAESIYIGLGANLNDPQRQLEQALRELQALPDSELIAVSALYRSAPVGPVDQPDFINAVAELRSGLPPLRLLALLQQLEHRHGRVRSGQRWGPRTLDLDLLMIGSRVLNLATLQLPHPRMHARAFVLRPLAEIAPPALEIPGHGRLDQLLEAVATEAAAMVQVAPAQRWRDAEAAPSLPEAPGWAEAPIRHPAPDWADGSAANRALSIHS